MSKLNMIFKVLVVLWTMIFLMAVVLGLSVGTFIKTYNFFSSL